MVFEPLDEPARVVDADEKIVAAVAEEGPRDFAQFPRLRPCEPRELPATLAADEAVLQRHAGRGVGALEEACDVGEERVHM